MKDVGLLICAVIVGPVILVVYMAVAAFLSITGPLWLAIILTFLGLDRGTRKALIVLRDRSRAREKDG